MKFSNVISGRIGNSRRCCRVLFLALLLKLSASFAQNMDDLPPPPPPPPPITDFGAPPAAPSSMRRGGMPNRAPQMPSGIADSSSNSENNLLDKGKKNKFNQARLEDITDDKFPETIESFDFPNAEITDVVKAISELTGKNFILEPGVRGKITIVAPSKITVAEAYKAFLSSLALNNLTVVPSGNFLKIKNSRNAQRDSIETYSGAYYPNTDQMITRIIHLKHIQAEQVARELRMLPSKDGDLNPYPPTNSIILSDYGSNIDRVMKILGQLDVPGFEEQLEVVQIKHAKAKDLAELVDKIVNKGAKSNAGAPGSFSAGVPRFPQAGGRGTQGQQGNSFFMAIPDDRTNSIIVVGNKAGIDRLKKLIAQLDFRIKSEESGNVHVYYVKFGDAEKIAQTLQGVTKDASPKPGPGGMPGGFPAFGPQAAATQEIFGGDVKIYADKATNSLIVTASKQDYEMVLSLLNKIDIARDQVFVETVIMEMSGGDGFKVDTGYYQYPDSGYGKIGFNGGLNIPELLSAAGGTGAVLGFGSDKIVNVKDPITGNTLQIPNLIGFINFLKKVTKANILSTPQITALDNQEAELEVGDRVVTSANITTGIGGASQASPQFEDATIHLTLKPIINPSSESIRMEIKQEVKQLSPSNSSPKALQDTTQPIQKRVIKTHLVVNNGDTAVLGGLMKDEARERVSKVPLLGDIPIIGWLFKSQERTVDKVNMLVLLTPKIIRTPGDSKNILTKKINDRIDFIKSQGGKDPYGKTIDEILKKTAYDGIKADADNLDGDSKKSPNTDSSSPPTEGGDNQKKINKPADTPEIKGDLEEIKL